jgi:hypothetical protein
MEQPSCRKRRRQGVLRSSANARQAAPAPASTAPKTGEHDDSLGARKQFRGGSHIVG